MLDERELTLHTTLTLGTLETNAAAIQDIVKAKLQDFTPANYIGKVDDAKADRALLNKAEKALNSRRLELEREYMEPFMTFKGLIADTCAEIKKAAGALDEIVKSEENREKDEKRDVIAAYWDSKEFTLFSLEKIFDAKWLNKSTKLKEIETAIDDRITRTLNDLKIIENFPAEDVPLLKSFYLDTLDITAAMSKAQQLKDARDRLAKEKAEREKLEKAAQLHTQAATEKDEVNAATESDKSASLIAAALDIDPSGPTTETFALVLKGTRDQLLNVRRCMTHEGVTYTKLEYDEETGSYKPGI